MIGETITLSFPYIITIAITSGLFAGLISTIGNMIIAFLNNKAQAKLEKNKYLSSINDFRYKELNKNLNTLCDLPLKSYLVNTREDMEELVKASNTEYEAVMSTYKRVCPLLDEILKNQLVNSVNKIDLESEKLVVQVFTQETNDGVQGLLQLRDQLREELIAAIQKQISIIMH